MMNVNFAERICYVYVARVIAALGIVGNILNLLILRRRTLKDSPYTYLTALAFAELIVLALMLGIGIVRCGSCSLNDNLQYMGRLYEFFIFLPFINMAHHSATFITLAMTVERYVFVRFPILARKLCTRGKARIAIISVVLTGIIINLPRFFMFTLHTPSTLMTAIFPPAFIIMECSLPIPFANSNTTSNLTSLTPRCVLSRLTSRNASEYSLNFIMQERLKERDLYFIDSLETLRELLGSSLIPIRDVKIGKCRNGVSSDNEQSDEYYDANGDELLSFVNWTELTSLSEKLKVEPFRIFAVANFTWMNFFNNVGLTTALNFSSMVQDAAGTFPSSSSVAFLQHLASKYSSGSDEIRILLNVTSDAVLTRLIDKLPCLQDNKKPGNKTSIQSTMSPIIVHATSAVVVRTTSFYDSYYKLSNYCVIIFEMLSVFAMALLNLAMIKLLRQSSQNRQRFLARSSCAALKRQLHDQQRLTVTLVIVTTFTALCAFFGTLISDPVAKSIFGDNFRRNFTFRWLTITNNIVSLTNNSINFALYALFNTRFRKEFTLAVTPLVTFICCFLGSNTTPNPHKNVAPSNSDSSINTICTRLNSSNFSESSSISMEKKTSTFSLILDDVAL